MENKEATFLCGPFDDATQILITYYTNLTFIAITQTGKLGTLTSASREHKTKESNILLGDREDLMANVYSTSILELIPLGEIILGLGLKRENKESRECFVEIMQRLKELIAK